MSTDCLLFEDSLSQNLLSVLVKLVKVSEARGNRQLAVNPQREKQIAQVCHLSRHDNQPNRQNQRLRESETFTFPGIGSVKKLRHLTEFTHTCNKVDRKQVSLHWISSKEHSYGRITWYEGMGNSYVTACYQQELFIPRITQVIKYGKAFLSQGN